MHEITEIITIHTEAQRLERERIMKLFEEIKGQIYRHVPSGSDTVSVQEIFDKFTNQVFDV